MLLRALPWIFQLLFWLPFIVRGRLDKWRGRAQDGPAAHRHPRAVAMIAAHTVAQAVSYVGLGIGVARGQADAFGPNALVGALVVQAGSALALWTLRTFRSWRLRAELTHTHQLEVDGPFAWVRHPIYVAMNLSGLGLAIWLPNPLTWLGFVLLCVAGDVRARAEEALLVGAFGDRYRGYMAAVRRFVPGVY